MHVGDSSVIGARTDTIESPHAALRRARASGDPVLLATVLVRHAAALTVRGDGSAVLEALSALPDGVRTGSVDLAAAEALALLALQRHEEARTCADRALALGPDAPVPAAWGRARVPLRDRQVDLALLEVWQARRGWRPPDHARASAARALGCRPVGSGREETHDLAGADSLRAARLLLELASLQIWGDDVDAAARHVSLADGHAEDLGHEALRSAVGTQRATIEMVRGSYRTAAVTAGRALGPSATPGAVARARLVRGVARFCALDLTGAEEDLAALDRASRRDPLDVVTTALLRAGLHLFRGELDVARRVLDAAEVPSTLPGFAARHRALVRIAAAGFAGDVAAVEAQAVDLRRADHHPDAVLARALALGMRGHDRAAVALLDDLLVDARLVAEDADHRGVPTVTASAAAACRVALLARTGTPEAVQRAADLVPDLLSRIAPEHLLVVLAGGTVVSGEFPRLLAAEARREDAHPLAAAAAAALERQGHLRAPHADRLRRSAGAPSLGRAPGGLLTGREREVLLVLSEGSTNEEIAARLFVSENTVKTHLASIYRKLGVGDRRGALGSARALDLL